MQTLDKKEKEMPKFLYVERIDEPDLWINIDRIVKVEVTGRGQETKCRVYLMDYEKENLYGIQALALLAALEVG